MVATRLLHSNFRNLLKWALPRIQLYVTRPAFSTMRDPAGLAQNIKAASLAQSTKVLGLAQRSDVEGVATSCHMWRALPSISTAMRVLRANVYAPLEVEDWAEAWLCDGACCIAGDRRVCALRLCGNVSHLDDSGRS